MRTHPYSEKDLEDILRIRSCEESVEIEADALSILTMLAMKTSLRYAMQLISTGNILRERRRGDKVIFTSNKLSKNNFFYCIQLDLPI